MNRLVMLGLAAACSAGAAQAGQEPAEYLEVGPELRDCVGVGPQKCMQVRPFGSQEWQHFYGAIEGFTHQEGHTYLLRVKAEKIDNPPADAPSMRWILERVVSEKESVARMLEPFPAPEPGHVRWAIDLPALPDEDDHKIELLPGKWMMVDCNRHWAGAVIEQRSLQGWGYSYYVMQDVGQVASTMMACPGQEKTNRFIPVGSMPELQRYNSRLPIVFYAPEEVELQYRVWRAAGSAQPAEKR